MSARCRLPVHPEGNQALPAGQRPLYAFEQSLIRHFPEQTHPGPLGGGRKDLVSEGRQQHLPVKIVRPSLRERHYVGEIAPKPIVYLGQGRGSASFGPPRSAHLDPVLLTRHHPPTTP